MIHEVLFNLWNCPQNVTEQDAVQQLIASLELDDFIHPGERELLQNVGLIGLKYHKIRDFIKSIDSQQAKPGLYLRAFCNGLDAALIDYKNEILILEDMFLNNAQLNTSLILAAVNKHMTLLNVLQSLIKTVQNDKLYGCLIMGKTLKCDNCGVESVTEATNRIVQCVSKVFYRQLCNWIIYGEVYDKYEEFFISDANCPDENFLYPEHKKSRIAKPAIVRKFILKQELLPGSVSRETGEIILFIGRIVWIMHNHPKTSSDKKYKHKLETDLWDGKSLAYYKSIQALENSAFDYCMFEMTIEECRKRLTKFLWSIMLEEANLTEHLQLIRDYYALGRGELFQHFIVTSEDHLKEMPNENAVQNLNFIFSDTARNIYSDNDKTYLRFELYRSDDIKSNSDPWSNLGLNFEIHWPLHIVFHPNSMIVYNKLFSFLLKIKKTHVDLHRLWLDHMEGKHKIDLRVWTLRHNLMFVVNNLQYYLQVDVIEAQFSVLQKAVIAADEFGDVIKLHAKFLTNLLTKTFVMEEDKEAKDENKHQLYQQPALNYEGTSKIHAVILRILELCNRFCFLAQTWESELTAPNLAEVEELQKESDTLIRTLLEMLHMLHERSSGQHLLQLLHQLDFNCWFSKHNTALS